MAGLLVARMMKLAGSAAPHILPGAAGNAGDSMQLREVLAAATAPYFSMLEAWLWQGRIVDPFQEFMVQQQVRAQAASSGMQTTCIESATTCWASCVCRRPLLEPAC